MASKKSSVISVKLKRFFKKFKKDFKNHRNQYTIILSLTIVLTLAFLATLGVQIYRCSTAAARITYTKGQLSNVNAKLAADPIVVGDEFSAVALQKIFGSDQLSLLTDKCWDYELLVNGKAVTDTTVKVKASKGVVITLRETYTASKFPKEVEMYGRATGNDSRVDVSNYISVSHNNILTGVKSQKDNIYNITYTPKNLKSGDSITIKMKPMLTQQMQLFSEDPGNGIVTIKIS